MTEIRFLSGLLGAKLDSMRHVETIHRAKRTTFWYSCTCMFARAGGEQSGVVGANNGAAGAQTRTIPRRLVAAIYSLSSPR